MRDKFALTQELLKHFSRAPVPDFDHAKNTWWFNPQQHGGLRLTAYGFNTLKNDIELDSYEYTLKDHDRFNTRTIIDLDRRLLMPYYLVYRQGQVHAIIFFGSKEAMIARLYDDLDRFLSNYT